MTPGEIEDEISAIAAFAKAVEMILTNPSFSEGKRHTVDAAIELSMLTVDKLTKLQDRLDGASVDSLNPTKEDQA